MIDGKGSTILIIEDDPGVARLQQRRLEQAGYAVVSAGTAEEGMQKLAQGSTELVLLDYRLSGGRTGLDVYAQLKTAGFNLPVIMVTGLSDEATVIKALRAGVRDFVSKSVTYLDYLPEAVERVLGQVRMEQRLALSEARLAGIISSARDAILTTDTDQCITLFNAAAEQIFRCSVDQAIGRPVHTLLPVLADSTICLFGKSAEKGHLCANWFEMRGVRADGEEFPLEASISSAEVGGRKFNIVIVRDITERQRAELALRSSVEWNRLIINTAHEAFIAIDSKGLITDWNPHATTILGWSREEAIGQPVAEIVIPSRYREAHKRGLQHFLVTHEGPMLNKVMELMALHRDGREFPVEMTIAPVLVGAEYAFFSFLRDITERKRANDRVKEQAALIDMTTNAILVRDLEGRIVFWNQGAERLYGWTAAEAMGKNFDQYCIEGPMSALEEARKMVIDKGEWTGEQRQLTKDRKEVIVESHWTLLRDENGQPKSKLVINTDITEKKKHEAQYLRAQRMESIGTLAGGIAHDLNNVLTPIVMAVELLNMKLTDPASRSFLAILETSAQRGADMVKQILAFARGTQGQRLPLHVKHVIRDIEKMLQHTLSKSIDVRTSVPRDLWTVSGDATQLHQVMMNLCVNAGDAMPHGGQLTITAENRSLYGNDARKHFEARPGPYLLLTVADTGKGIPADVLDKIFDPFFTTKELGKGTGLGLSTVEGIVKNHGGFVTVYSEIDKGTQFSVYLPAIESAHTKDAAEVCRRLPVGDGELILVVDDEASIREITKATLEAHAYQVLTANDGTEALALYAKHQGKFQAVVIDIMMPILDGPTTIRALQKLDPHARIIAVSGLAANGKAAEAARLGVQSFLPKPFTAEALLTTLHEFLARRTESVIPPQ